MGSWVMINAGWYKLNPQAFHTPGHASSIQFREVWITRKMDTVLSPRVRA